MPPGLDLDDFVYPERISSQLICPICTQVLENPVQTPTDHLFCEDELLEWLSRSTLCPATNTPLDPDAIGRPSRIIVNMLAELQRYCPNRAEGCTWKGENEHTAAHVVACTFRPRALVVQDLTLAEEKISKLRDKLVKAEKKIEMLTHINVELASTNAINERKLRVYNAFLSSSSNEPTSLSALALAGRTSNLKSGSWVDTAPEEEQQLMEEAADRKPERGGAERSALQEILGYK